MLRLLLNQKYLNLYVSIGLFFLYCLTIPEFLPDADGPEFTVIGIAGGIAHPPGYPLYCLILRAINLLILKRDTAFAAFGYLSAFLTGVASLIVLDMLSKVGVSALSRCATVGIVFTSFAIWHIANNIEPFSLNLLLCSAVLWCTGSLIFGEKIFSFSRQKTVITLGLIFGLGVCNHHTQAILVPMTFFALIKTAEGGRLRARDAAFFTSGFAFGLLPISYFFFTNLDAPMVWGLYEWREEPLSRLLKHLLRVEYGTFQLVASQNASLGAQFLFHLLAESLLYLGVPLAIWGGWTGLKKQNLARPNHPLFTLCLLINLIPITVFFLMAKGHSSDMWGTIFARFVAMPALVVSPLMALGMEEIKDRFQTFFSWAAMVPIVILNIIINLPISDRKNQRLPEYTVKTMLEICKNGFFIGYSDLTWAGVPFLQVVRGIGTNVKFVIGPNFEQEKHREALFRNWRIPYSTWKGATDFFDFATFNGGLCFEDPPLKNTVLKTKFYPLGPVFKIDNFAAPSPTVLFRMNEDLHKELMASTLLRKELISTGWERFALRKFGQPWAILAESLKQSHPQLSEKARMYEKMFQTNDNISTLK
jgi:hypothetical protein